MGLLRKSKPQVIKVLAAPLVALTLVSAAGAAPPPLRLVRIAVDRTSTANAQHSTIVEPDAAAAGSRIVATYQVGRFFGGSSGAIGFARSTDSGRSWRSGLLPNVAGAVQSDPVVAFDALHGRWVIATLVNSATTSSLAAYSSADGLGWSAPVTVVAYPRPQSGEGTAVDKEWLACDNGATSPFRGHCYLAYTDVAHRGEQVGVQTTTDGGATWSAPFLFSVDADRVSPAVQPVVRPNGELVIVFFEDDAVEAVRSNDGGATFTTREQISPLQFASTRPLRGFSLPTAAVDRDGNVYAAWPDCRFRASCAANDIVWTRSSSAGVWTPVRRLVPSSANLTLPDIAADPVSANRLAVTYYSLTARGLDVFLVTSKSAGGAWTKPRRLNPVRMPLTWLAQTNSGRMVGDYTATLFSGARIVAVHVQARAPRGGVLNEAVYAASVPRP